MSGKYDSAIAPTLLMSETRKTRGNDFCLKKFCSKYDMRKFYFTLRVVDAWNSLLNWVVSANNINAIKKRLDQHGNIKISYTIFEPKLKELEALVRF